MSGGRGGSRGGEVEVAAEAVFVGFAEEGGGFGEGAEFGDEGFVWDVFVVAVGCGGAVVVGVLGFPREVRQA